MKDELTDINGIGDYYASKIVEVYDSKSELLEDDAHTISQRSGVPVWICRKLEDLEPEKTLLEKRRRW